METQNLETQHLEIHYLETQILEIQQRFQISPFFSWSPDSLLPSKWQVKYQIGGNRIKHIHCRPGVGRVEVAESSAHIH